MNYYEHHLGDWAAATGHLTWDEDMAYTRLLRAYYHAERAIPQGQQYRLAKASTPAQRKAVDAVLAEFFELRDDGFHQKRADAEIERYRAGEPDREAKKANEEARLKRHREERARLFQELAAVGQHAAWNVGMNELRALVKRYCTPLPATAPATPATATHTQTPDTRPSNTNTSQLTLATDFPPESRQADPPQLALVEAPKPKVRTVPDCPHQAVLALWAECLPALPQHNPGLWRGARADHLRARWRETAASEGWETEDQGIAYFRRLFGFIGRSAFLTGRAKASDGRPPFVAELAWIVCPENWAKVHEGKYHIEAA